MTNTQPIFMQNGKKTQTTLFKSGTRQDCSLSPFLLSKIALALKQPDKRKSKGLK